jgi:hypothetical protein
MAKGRKTPDQIIAMAQTKFPLTDAQQQQIRAAAPRAASPAAEKQQQQPAAEKVTTTEDGEIHMTYAQVADRITKAANVEELDLAGGLISSVQDVEQRKELNTLWEDRSDALNAPTA